MEGLKGERVPNSDGAEFVFDSHSDAAKAAVRINIAGYTARTDGVYLRVGGKIKDAYRRNPAYHRPRKPRLEVPVAHVTPDEYDAIQRLRTARDRMDYLKRLGFREIPGGYRVRGDG